jgi:hypothetical protein
MRVRGFDEREYASAVRQFVSYLLFAIEASNLIE